MARSEAYRFGLDGKPVRCQGTTSKQKELLLVTVRIRGDAKDC